MAKRRAPVRNLLEYATLKLQAMRVGAIAIERKREFVSIKFSQTAAIDRGEAGAICRVAAWHAIYSRWHIEILDQDRQRRGNSANAARFAGRTERRAKKPYARYKLGIAPLKKDSEMRPMHERRTNGERRKQRVVRKAIFPAAGLGTRFLPATKAQPKEMLPLVDKPIIQYGVEEAVAAGCDQIIIITGRGKSAIEDHFDVSYELEKMLEEKGKTRPAQDRAPDFGHDLTSPMCARKRRSALGTPCSRPANWLATSHSPRCSPTT